MLFINNIMDDFIVVERICRFGKMCRNKETCNKTHNTCKVICKYQDRCNRKNCKWYHKPKPKYDFICKFGQNCTTQHYCEGDHTLGCKILCNNGFYCKNKNTNCTWSHNFPECMFGSKCIQKKCTLKHTMPHINMCHAGRECFNPTHCEESTNRTHNHPRLYLQIKCKQGMKCKKFNYDPTSCSYIHGDYLLKEMTGYGIDFELSMLSKINCPIAIYCMAIACPYKHNASY